MEMHIPEAAWLDRPESWRADWEPAAQPAAHIHVRPSARGKFLYAGADKLWIRGATYGTFRPATNGHACSFLDRMERDFAAMAASGLNAVRLYTVPSRPTLDTAQRHGLRVLAGLPWEQHVAFLDDRKRAADIEDRVRAGVRDCAGHPALLGFAIGNEIPAPIVRWYGRRRIERYLRRLYLAAKTEDPESLVTYVNYPSTEYLELPFLDFICFNVYLESKDRFESYLTRLHNLAGNRPLVMAEIGLDSRRNGEEAQARALKEQLQSSFAGGCAGAFVFAWTDEWHRGGHDIEDWDFGLTDRQRRPKKALATVRNAFAQVPFPKKPRLPRISVVVCTYNGSRTLRDSLDGLLRLEYPNFEVIVVNDGSTDGTESIAESYGFRVITTENRGLSSARNTGMEAATGEIVAYIDDDAYPDPHWLSYLADTFQNTRHAAVGGPNIAPAGDGAIADCVANAPGGPVHILLSDNEAEHIPGCNMAFRKAALREIGGFDPQFRAAGDDVDVCWKIQSRGWTIGFNPAAMVWHHRRNSIRAYWKQQINYGKAEALLEKKWPERYNAAGHVTWGGRVYGNGHSFMLGRAWRIYYGVWGKAPFQSLYQRAPGTLLSFPLMPEWYLLILLLSFFSVLGFLWRPLFLALPFLGVAAVAPLAQACASGARASSAGFRSPGSRFRFLTLTAVLHLLQPLARLRGRMSAGLTLWRWNGSALAFPWPRKLALWSEHWQDPEKRLEWIESELRGGGAVVRRAGDYDRWDLEIRGGIWSAVRLIMAVEEHGAGRQLARFRSWPLFCPAAFFLTLLFSGLSLGAALSGGWAAAGILAGGAVLVAGSAFRDCGAATAAVLRALERLWSHNGNVRQEV